MAKWNGGGVYAESNSKVNISRNTKFGNSAERQGGGIFAVNVSISGDAIFAGNSATDGGGVCVEFNSMVNIQRNAVVYSWIIIFISGNTTFIGNTARIRGGGVLTIDT